MTIKNIRRWRAALAGALFFNTMAFAAAEDTYASRLTGALQALNAGDTARAHEDLRQALRYDANHPLAWSAYGVLLLNTGGTAEARRCFQRAATLDPAAFRPLIGLALCDLAEGKSAVADTRFAEAEGRGAPTASVHRAYIAAMGGRLAEAATMVQPALTASGSVRLASAAAPAGTPVPAPPLADAVWAYARDKQKEPDAAAAWESARQRMESEGRGALLASFLPHRPLVTAWQPRRVPPPPYPQGKPVSGAIILRGAAGPRVTHVVFTVDGRTGSITNRRPFSWEWNTAAVPDGWHTVGIRAVKEDGSTVWQERVVVTRNAKGKLAAAHQNLAEPQRLLDAALTLRPDARYARYILALKARDAGDPNTARAHLEEVVSDDPGYRDSLSWLRGLAGDARSPEVWRGATGRKVIALTFDDGPNPARTPELLDLLADLRLPATFFVVGKQAVQHPDIIRRMKDEGHQVENHTWNHRNLARLSEAEVLQELGSTRRLLERLTGRESEYFRPPGGNISPAARSAAGLLGLKAAMWTHNTGKSEGLPVEEMVPAFLAGAQPGAIFLIHNGTRKIPQMLPIVVKRLREQGYEFVTLSDVMQADTAPPVTPAPDGQAG